MCPAEPTGHIPDNLTKPVCNYAYNLWAGYKDASKPVYRKAQKVVRPSTKLVLNDSPMPYVKEGSQAEPSTGYYWKCMSNSGNAKSLARLILPRRHGKNFNALMADAHVESRTREMTKDADFIL